MTLRKQPITDKVFSRQDLEEAVKQERERIIARLKVRFSGYESNPVEGISRVTFALPEDWEQALEEEK